MKTRINKIAKNFGIVFTSVTVLFICVVTAQAQETTMAYPQAEWSKAGDILMHTPGQELFCGVIHPSAGLFEDYFDVDKAAEEHRGYISMLEKNGIRVAKVDKGCREFTFRLYASVCL